MHGCRDLTGILATADPDRYGWLRTLTPTPLVRRKLLRIHAATELASLRIPPGNQLEALRADRKGQHSIRINDQWRICFVWKTEGAHRVEIVDYH